MTTKRRGYRVVAAVMCVVLPAFVTLSRASEQNARDFVASIYAPYVDNHSEGAGLDTEADYFRRFEPKLASSLFKDATAAWERKDLAKLNFDLFMDASAWSLHGLTISIAKNSKRRAVATVTFINSERPTTVALDLVKLTVGWRVNDIRGQYGDLRARYVKE